MNEKTEIPAEAKTPELPLENVASLKAAREARGLSLNDVFNATRVSRINLEALENDDFDRLPPPVYTRNFIRKYAQAVGVDEKPILDRYEKHREGLTPSCEETEVQKPWPEDGRRYRFLFGTLAAVIVAGVLVYAIFLYDQQSHFTGDDRRIDPAGAGYSCTVCRKAIAGGTESSSGTSACRPTHTGNDQDNPCPRRLNRCSTNRRSACRCSIRENTPPRHRGAGIDLDKDHGRPESLLSGSPQAGRQDRADGLRLLSCSISVTRGESTLIFQGKPLGKPGETGAGHPYAPTR